MFLQPIAFLSSTRSLSIYAKLIVYLGVGWAMPTLHKCLSQLFVQTAVLNFLEQKT